MSRKCDESTLKKPESFLYNRSMAGRSCSLTTAYQQYGEPPGQKSVQQRTPRCWRPSHRSSRGCGRASGQRECHLLGRPLARKSAMTLFGNTMRRHAWPPHERGGAALGLKAAETLDIRPRRSCRTCPVLFPNHRGGCCKCGGTVQRNEKKRNKK